MQKKNLKQNVMSRILKQLKEYDNSVTVGELIQKLEQEEQISAEKELKEIQEVKDEFENTYVKYIDEDGLFGKTLTVMHFKDFDRKDLDEEYKAIYTIEAEVLCFSKRDFYKKEIRKGWCDGSFSAEELKSMIKITEEEYNLYLEKYNRISNELKEIVNGR